MFQILLRWGALILKKTRFEFLESHSDVWLIFNHAFNKLQFFVQEVYNIPDSYLEKLLLKNG